MNDKTPANEPDGAAVGAQVQRPVRPGSEAPRWYCLSREGMATLCRNEEEARITAADADMSWPGGAPHRAVMLVDVAERDAAFAMTRCECGADEACANLARMGVEIERLRGLLSEACDMLSMIGCSSEGIARDVAEAESLQARILAVLGPNE